MTFAVRTCLEATASVALALGLGAPSKVFPQTLKFSNGRALYKVKIGLTLSKIKFQACSKTTH